MTPLLRKFLGMNWLLLVTMLVLAIIGVFAINSVVYMRSDPAVADFWRRQALWVALGVVGFIIVSLIDYRWIRWGALPLYLASIVFLVLTMFIGRKVYGARSWLQLGPINFQPAQLAIIAGILVMALFLSQFKNLHPMLRLMGAGLIAGGPMLLIIIQPDFGSTIAWVPVILGLLFAGGMPLRYLICILLIGLILMPLMFNFGLKDYQRARITAFIDPEMDPKGSAWAINQSLIAVGSGGWSGKGFKAPNTQVELGFLPSTAVHNDYIFSAIGEQFGFLGGTVLITLFGFLMLICLYIAYRSSDELGLLIAVGIGALLFFHVYENIGMTISIMPITGVPLPLVSYGGSFVLMVMLGLGVVNSIWIHRREL